jgi:hypothetical protein
MELRNYERELAQFHLRIGVAGVLVLIGFGLLAARFIFLQVVQHDHYASRAEDNRISIVPIAPNRGLILDRNGIVMARNYSGYTLEIFPRKVRSIERTIDEVAELVEITSRDRARFKKLLAETRNAESLPIRTRLSDEEVAKFAANRYRYNGTVEIKARLFRQYPYDETAAHVMGYMGRINTADQQRLEEEGVDANYRGTDFIGKAGVEASYQNELHGTDRLRARRDRRRGPRHPHAFAHALAAGQQRRADARPAAAAGGRAGARRPARRGGGARAFDRRGARVRVQARLRSELLRRRHRPGVLGRAQQLPRPAALQPGDRRDLSSRVDLQAVHGARRPRDRQAHPAQRHQRSRLFRLRRPALPRLQARRERLRRPPQVDRGVLRHVLLHARERHGHRRHRRPT